MVIGLHAENPRNRVSIPKVGRDSSTLSRPVLGSMQLMVAGDCFPKDKVSLAHHSSICYHSSYAEPEQRIRVESS